MKSNIEKVGSLQRKLSIQVPAPTVDQVFDKLFKQVQQQSHIKGFRPGKAPLQTIKTMYTDRVSQDAVQELIQKHYYEALKTHEVDPISYPEFEFDVPATGKEFSFTASFEVRPEISLKKYEGLSVIKEKYVFDQERVSKVLDNIRSSRAELVPVLEERPAQKGDTAIIDFDGSVDGKAIEGGKGVDHKLELGSNSFIEGFEEGIEGMRVDGTKTLDLKFPDPYHSVELAGKPVQFIVKLKQLKKKALPELNDEFLKSIGANETVEQLTKNIENDVESTEKKRIEQDLKNRLLKELVSLNPVDVPPSMLKEQKQILIDDMKKRMVEQGLPETQYSEYVKKWDADFEASAKEMIQAGFVIDAIAKKHTLAWTKEDVDQKIEEYSKQTGIDSQKVREFYAKPEQMQRMTYMITEEKVVAFLLNSASIKEVDKSKIKTDEN